ncbi:RadC family protein [Chromobacterium vaccinii]|uniref:RadC family protein n=1 Tax=Chromobacterium vaccinii TaxID=1108595 RepID=UPI003458C0BB
MTQDEQHIIQQALSILDKHLKTTGVELTSPQAVRDYLRLQIECEEREIFAVLFLNAQNLLIAYVPMFAGTLTEARVYPREIVREGLRLNAASIIMAHNHPSGNATPSEADVQLTRTVQAACNLVDIRVLDHFVVGTRWVSSLAELGKM